MTKQMTNTTTQEAQQVINTSATNIAQGGRPIMFTQEQYDQILKLISTGENASFAGTSKIFVTNEKVKDENWIVDSGATNHMVHTRELLDKINTDILGNAPKVYLLDGTSLDVECTGESRIDENSTVKNDLHSGKHQKLEAKAANVHLQKSTMQEEDLKVWHGRLGHAPNRVVRQIPNMKFKTSSDEIKECTICPLARQGRLPFPKSTSRSDKPFQLIHVDVWGPYRATIYVINRFPLSVLLGKLSFEMLHGRVPSLKHLRTIRCLYFAKVVGGKDKFAARLVGTMLMGYSLSQKGYTLYNSLTNSFFVSRDVKFMEHVFPFQLLKEGKLQLFPNGVLHYPVTTDVIPAQINTQNDDASLSAMPPVADNHTANTQPSSPLPLFSEDTPSQQSPLSEHDTHVPVGPSLRKSARITKKHVWLQDYVCNGSLTRFEGQQLCKYPMHNYLTHAGFSVKHQYLSKITGIREPLTYEGAASDPKWLDAMHQELNALKGNRTWTM
ncbi:uncharacterized protein LOC107770479 [Nicotiana tabacum]|uniref:Uncharacterized protein LOC107770479 n=1 Tax=Nicotiana tabacum TaxID=4097 RepID=A0AC58TGX4_TOBAC